jgi:hypothetical protein
VLKNGNELTVEAYQKQIRATRNILRKAKKEGWQKYTQTFNATTPTKVIWDKEKAFQKGWSRPQSSPEGALNLTSYHKHICPEYVPEKNEITPNLITTASHHPNHQPFTLQELNDVVKNIKDSATGTDNINYSMIKWLPDIGHTHFLQLYNSFWNSGLWMLPRLMETTETGTYPKTS